MAGIQVLHAEPTTYVVGRAQFVPSASSNSLVSCSELGDRHKLTIWDINEKNNSISKIASVSLDAIPLDIAFSSNTQLLVGTSAGNVLVFFVDREIRLDRVLQGRSGNPATALAVCNMNVAVGHENGEILFLDENLTVKSNKKTRTFVGGVRDAVFVSENELAVCGQGLCLIDRRECTDNMWGGQMFDPDTAWNAAKRLEQLQH
jgi:hypothetical protein